MVWFVEFNAGSLPGRTAYCGCATATPVRARESAIGTSRKGVMDRFASIQGYIANSVSPNQRFVPIMLAGNYLVHCLMLLFRGILITLCYELKDMHLLCWHLVHCLMLFRDILPTLYHQLKDIHLLCWHLVHCLTLFRDTLPTLCHQLRDLHLFCWHLVHCLMLFRYSGTYCQLCATN
jgi:hypothetical protein